MNSLNRVEISRGALVHNFHLCRRLAGEADIMVMVKADGYGHGMISCARIFAEQGAAALGVAEAVEGLRLRQAGLTLPVFVLVGSLPQSLPVMLDANLTPVITDATNLGEFSRLAEETGVKVGVHLKMDAGMGRQGTLPGDFLSLVQRVQAHANLRIDGVMAHFPMADDPGSLNSWEVLHIFRETTAALDILAPGKCCLHLANSGGLFYVAGSRFNMVRLGLALYGCYPDGHAGRKAASLPLLRPAMRFTTQVIQLRRIPAGHGLGYSHLFTTSRPSTIAVLPVGYGAGYLRSLSNTAQVLIRGHRAPVVGRVSMNLTLIDVTGLEDVEVGDEVVLLGRQGDDEITADDVADWMGTISYEVLCLFGNLNNRVLVE
ncbi:alanine racemase [Desulfobulbus alkaliphilus]|nr:alanine racemase [Desulfobulbus alkaliphilus]